MLHAQRYSELGTSSSGGVRWLGVVTGLEAVLFAAGLLSGGVNHPLTVIGGLVFAWVFLIPWLIGLLVLGLLTLMSR